MTTETTGPAVIWPPLEGWKTETIPFPLDFAPQLAYKTGHEELRFSPFFGKSDRPLFFTYAFLWVLPDTAELTREGLEHDLTLYFDGLMKAVAKDKGQDVGGVTTKVTVVDAPPGPDLFKWTATVDCFDAFFTRKPIQLEVHVIPNVKVQGAWRVHYFEATPLPVQMEAVGALKQVRAQLSQ